MVQELKSQIKTRGLEEGGGGGPDTPLRHFKGDLVLWTPSIQTGSTNGRDWQRIRIKMDFEGIEVIRSETPYDFPIASITIPGSTRAKSFWGIYAASAEQFIPEDIPDESRIDWLLKKRLEIEYTSGHMLWDGTKETPREAWEIKSVEGAASKDGSTTATPSGPNARDQAIELLDGKSLAGADGFNQESMKVDAIRNDSDLMGSIINGEFNKAVVEEGLFTVDEDGVYHKVTN